VWFDSGVCHAAVQKRRGLGVPADIYLEGSDQHRGWFNTSMLSSMATNGVPPFKALITHGFVTDPSGRKMSKSLGNYIDPMEVNNQSGAEIIRLWASSEDYGQDVSCGKESLTRVTETYRRLRNTMKYLLGSLHDFDFAKDAVPVEKMTAIDRWALHELNDLVARVTDAYERYEFHRVYHSLNVFFTVFLSATYLDVLKDRLYTWKADGLPRRSSQTVIHHLTDTLIRLMAPVLSFLAEEAYSHAKTRAQDSVFLLDFPEPRKEWENADLKAHYDELLKVRADVQKNLEQLRADKVIGASLEAAVTITAPDATLAQLRRCENLREFLIVSRVDVRDGIYKIEAGKAAGEKCVRCWTYSESLGQNQALPGICPKCVEALT
jgi:isoleucyl-tRNA synthetase